MIYPPSVKVKQSKMIQIDDAVYKVSNVDYHALLKDFTICSSCDEDSIRHYNARARISKFKNSLQGRRPYFLTHANLSDY